MDLSWVKGLFPNDENGVICVESVEPGVKKGENHNSQIIRAVLARQKMGGKTEQFSIILKQLPQQPTHVKFVKENRFFEKEIQVYTIVLEAMEKLMRRHNDSRDLLWGKLYGSKEDMLVLEDLRSKGFELLDRREMLDLDESQIVMEAIARYHAMSRILILEGQLNPRKMFQPWMYLENEKIMNMAFHNCLKALGIVMKKHWGPEWSGIADKISKIPETLTSHLRNLGQVNERNFNVVNHGDCWTCNVLFQYDSGGRAKRVKFIDFPVAHYNSFAWDVVFFIFNSVKATTRRKHLPDLIQTYHHSLNDTFSRYNRADEMRPLEAIREEVEQLKFLSILLLCTIHPLLTSDMTETVVSDEPFKEDERTMALFTQLYTSPKYMANVKDDLEEYFGSR